MRDCYLDLAHRLGIQVIIFLQKTKMSRNTSEAKELVSFPVMRALKGISGEHARALRTSATVLQNKYETKHMLSLGDEDGGWTSPTTNMAESILTPLLHSVTSLIRHHDRRDQFREADAAMHEEAEMERQMAANDELEAEKEKDDAVSQAYEQIVEKIASIVTKDQLKQLKGVLRVKSSAGAKNSHASASNRRGAARSTNDAARSNGS